MTDTTTPAAPEPTGIDAAFAEAGITDADFGVTPEPAPEAAEPVETPSSGPERDEFGRFKPKEAAPETQEPAQAAPVEEAKPAPLETPAGLSEAAKAAWAETPEAVRADVQRRFREMETGLQSYQRDFGDLKEYVQLAKANGTTLKAALDNYVGIEKMLATAPAAAIQKIAQNVGIDLAQIFEKPGEAQPDRTIAALRQEIAELKKGFGGVQETLQQQRQTEIQRNVEAFAASKPRFDELASPDVEYNIAHFIERGYGLEQAYTLAERMNPAPVAPPAPAAPQTRKPVANLSVAGAPGNGSNPMTRKPPVKIEDHLGEIFRQVGINS